MTNILTILSIVTITNTLILIFYEAFKLKWPELYFSISDKAALFVSVSPKRYIVFRLLPTFVVITFIAGVFVKSGNYSLAMYSGLFSGLFYSLLTSGRAIVDLVTNSSKIKTYFNKAFQILLHLVSIALLIITGLVAGVISNTALINSLTPTVQGLVDNIWSSLIAVLLIVYLEKIYSSDVPDIEDIFKKSIKNIEPRILTTIDSVSKKHNAKAILVKAICLVENIQRPKWVRNIENLKAKLKIEGTYGIMQVSNNHYISDIESIEIAVEKWFKYTSPITANESIKNYISKYNADTRYVDLVLQAMYFLDPNSMNYPG